MSCEEACLQNTVLRVRKAELMGTDSRREAGGGSCRSPSVVRGVCLQ